MFLTTKNGEIEVRVGSKIFVSCLITDKKDEVLAVEINGHCNGEINPKITLDYRTLIGEHFQTGEKTAISFKVIGFQGIRPVLQFPNDNRRIVLNSIEDMLGLA